MKSFLWPSQSNNFNNLKGTVTRRRICEMILVFKTKESFAEASVNPPHFGSSAMETNHLTESLATSSTSCTIRRTSTASCQQTSLQCLRPNRKNRSFHFALCAAERSLNTEGGLDKGQEVNSPSRTFVFQTSPSAARRPRGPFHLQPPVSGCDCLLKCTHTHVSITSVFTHSQAGCCCRDAALEGFSRQTARQTREEAVTFVLNLQFRG